MGAAIGPAVAGGAAAAGSALAPSAIGALGSVVGSLGGSAIQGAMAGNNKQQPQMPVNIPQPPALPAHDANQNLLALAQQLMG